MATPRYQPFLQRVEGQGGATGINEDLDCGAIREPVVRLLASPVFRNSRRNSSLLRHVVERTLNGRPEELKERSIGGDAFGKSADYATKTDHVVRCWQRTSGKLYAFTRD